MEYKDKILFKVILIGDSGVGKTSILERYIYNRFNKNILSSLGMNYVNKVITLNNEEKIELKLFDTAGQEKFKSASKSYFRNVDSVLFVYSIDDINSFKNIKEWILTFMNNHNGKENIPLYLVENKNDLDRKVSESLIDDFLGENNNFHFKSISAALEDNNGINELFQELSEILYKNEKES